MPVVSQRPVRDWVHTMHRLQPYGSVRALWLAFASAVILSAVMTVGAVDPSTRHIAPNLHLPYVAIANLILFLALYFFNFFIIRCGLKGAALTLTGLAGSLLISTLFAPLQWSLEKIICGLAFNSFILTLIIDNTAALISYLVSLLLNNVTTRQQTLLQNEHLLTENMSIRYETLVQQVSPHFLFNSLNTLDGLIGIDDHSAHRYLRSLADTFRYILQQHDTVTLADELQFTRNYIAMMQMRYGDGALRVEEAIDPTLLNCLLPPISLQLVVENAVKHNIATNRHPLTISISSNPDSPCITVSNPKQPKADSGSSNGIGLANLSGRFKLLFHTDISISDSPDQFTVQLPLSCPTS